jgi:hypothetical protein
MNQRLKRHLPFLAFLLLAAAAIAGIESLSTNPSDHRLAMEIFLVIVLALAILSRYEPPKRAVAPLPRWVGWVAAGLLIVAAAALVVLVVARIRT